jgi:hypothetical protein
MNFKDVDLKDDRLRTACEKVEIEVNCGEDVASSLEPR